MLRSDQYLENMLGGLGFDASFFDSAAGSGEGTVTDHVMMFWEDITGSLAKHIKSVHKTLDRVFDQVVCHQPTSLVYAALGSPSANLP